MAQDVDEKDTRCRIVRQAEEFFRLYGYQKTTVADIAKALRMSPANVYRFFDSKKSINEEVALRLMGEVVPGLPPGPYPEDWAAVHHVIDEGWMYSLRFDDGITSAGFAVTFLITSSRLARPRSSRNTQSSAFSPSQSTPSASGIIIHPAKSWNTRSPSSLPAASRMPWRHGRWRASSIPSIRIATWH